MEEYSPPIERSNSIHWKEWRTGLPERVTQQVSHECALLLDASARTRESFREEKRDENRIAVVISAHNADDVLPATLREISEQIRALGKQGDIFIVSNNGGGTTDRIFLGEDAPERLGVDRVIRGYTEPSEDQDTHLPTVAKPVAIDQRPSDMTEGVNLFVITQYKARENEGKIRGLRDVYEYIYQENQDTGYCPGLLLAMDAETRFRSITPGSKERGELPSGLDHMVELTRGGKAIVGAKLNFTPYTKNGDPDWQARIPPMQETISLLHGSPGFQWEPGGGTLGNFPDMVSMMRDMSQQLPGTRVEDVFLTVMARTYGISTVVDQSVIHANRCPAYTKESFRSYYDQMFRWMQGGAGLEEFAGKDLSETVLNVKLLDVIMYPLMEAAKNFRNVDIPHLIKGLPDYIRASVQAKAQPDKMQSGSATW
jgi:hypothetical protein